jgi:hypothetical protein
LSCTSRFQDDTFWQDEILPNTVFHRRLFRLMRKFLLSTYENAHATAQVVIVDPQLARRCRWSSFSPKDGIAILDESKMARRLSDGEYTAFAFSGSGELLGFYDVEALDARLAEAIGQSPKEAPTPGVCRWTIRHQSTLQFHLGLSSQKELKLEYSNGEWRYVDLPRIFRVLSQEETSLNGVNRRLWEVALTLSDRRKGGLILIAKDAASLIEHSVCNEDELNLPGETRLDTQNASTQKLSLKEFLLEQFRGSINIEQLSMNLLMRLASVDGALIISQAGDLLGFGIILKLSSSETFIAQEGARTNAAILGSRFGVAIKISADGPISIFKNGAALW